MIGTTVSRYKILSKLGGGGMGVVHEAEDTELGRRVAIKFLPEETAQSPDALERFKREARAASALDHPHICVVHDVGTHQGQPYLVMKRLRGNTLKHLIGSGEMSVDDVVRLGEQFADALDAAHRAGIVHRDLKPANLFVTERGDGKILDFGLAKIATAASGRPVDAEAPTVEGDFLTAAGTTLGTVAYMSPEQAKGRVVDARSDLFSLGVVLYEMATGRLPFSGESTAELFAAILNKEPTSPREVNPQIPARIEELILKTLEKDPALRYQTAAGLRGDLLRLKRDTSVMSRAGALATSARDEKHALKGKDETGSRRGLWVGMGAVAIAVLAAVSWFATLGKSPGGANGEERVVAGSGAPASVSASVVSDKSIAVLPFVNMSSDQEQEYFSDGISEELLNLLTKIPELRVTSRSSAFSFKGQQLEIPEVARRLHVAYVLEGSVRKSGNRVRITAQLVDARSDTHLWSQTWDRTLEDIFAVQDEIAAGVVSQLRLTLLGAVPQVKRVDPRAFALFLEARQTGRQGTPEGLERSNLLYQQALTIDPEYAAAWTGLAANEYFRGNRGLRPVEEAFRLAREAANKALAINPDFALAHAQLGAIARNYDGDLAAAAQHLEQALALEPADPDIIVSAALLARALGRLDEAIALGEYAVARDPVNPEAHVVLSNSYRYAGRFDEAIGSARTAVLLSPARIVAQAYIGSALLLKGEPEAALAAFERESSESYRRIGLAMTYHALGRHAAAEATLDELIAKDARVWAYNIACVLAFRGEPNRAFAWLDKAVDQHDTGLAGIGVQPELANLHQDPRWLPFLRKIGKAPEQLAKIEFHVTLPQ